jgi:hypothetical protein
MSTPYCIVVFTILNIRVVMAEVIRNTRTRYAGHLGILIPNWFIYLNLVLSKFGSLYNGWEVAVKHVVCPEEFLVLFNKIR